MTGERDPGNFARLLVSEPEEDLRLMLSEMTRVATAQRPPRAHVAVRARGSAWRIAPPLTRVDSPSGFAGNRRLAAS